MRLRLVVEVEEMTTLEVELQELRAENARLRTERDALARALRRAHDFLTMQNRQAWGLVDFINETPGFEVLLTTRET